jgi:hypothetical protein
MNTRMKGILAGCWTERNRGLTGAIARDGYDGRHDGDRGRHEQLEWPPGWLERSPSSSLQILWLCPSGPAGLLPRAASLLCAAVLLRSSLAYYYGEPSVVINVPPFVFNFD